MFLQFPNLDYHGIERSKGAPQDVRPSGLREVQSAATAASNGLSLMTVRQLPPITALRAFEAAARHMSFTRAAEELHVTQAAVSYQVRQLEQIIGVALFRRLHRSLILTDAARAYLPIVRQVLDLLSKGTAQLKRPKFDGLLKVSASQSLTPRWLAHRIRRFSSDFPEYDIHIDATDAVVDFTHSDIDLAIRYA